MKTFLKLTLLVILFACFAVSCGKSSSDAVLIDYGLYDATVLVSGNWKLGFPVSIVSSHGVEHKKTTLSIPCEDGRYWGFRAHLKNSTTEPVLYRFEINHPEIVSPDGKHTTLETGELEIQPGESDDQQFLWFFLDSCPHEFVPGEWTMVLKANEKEVISKTFTIRKPDA